MRVFRRVSKIAWWVLAAASGILIFAYLGVSVLIGLGVHKESRSAMARFSGDRIEALMSLVDCRDCRLEDRNHAVWALGQLRDMRALPILYKYRTGKSCIHSHQICQYEISKAIRWIEGNSYMLPQIWRVMVLDNRRSVVPNNPS
jgi:hypothetical protein